MATPISIFLDTSVLPVNPVALSAEFRTLAELASENEVRVYMSSIAYKEWISQRQSDFVAKAESTRTVINNLVRDKWSPILGIHRELTAARDWILENEKAISQAAHDKASDVLDMLSPTVLKITADHAPTVFHSYFQGGPPFASMKARGDIPDAFILESLRDLAATRTSPVHAAIRDKRLRKAASDLPQVTVHENLQALFEAPEILAAQDNLQRAGAWRAWLDEFRSSLATLNDVVTREICDRAIDAVAYKTVHHDQIPDDNNEGTITGYDEPTEINIDWDSADEFGVGILSVPVEFNVDVSIDFSVFRMDAYSVPDGVSVSFGDPEYDHFFEAEGTVSTHVRANVVFEIPEEDIDDLKIRSVSELALVDDIDIEVIEHDGFRIFH